MWRMKTAILKRAIIILITISSFPAAQSQELTSIPQINGEIKFDGIVDDACWEGADDCLW